MSFSSNLATSGDDGLLLNFVASDAISRPVKRNEEFSHKPGSLRWKERLKLRRRQTSHAKRQHISNHVNASPDRTTSNDFLKESCSIRDNLKANSSGFSSERRDSTKERAKLRKSKGRNELGESNKNFHEHAAAHPDSISLSDGGVKPIENVTEEGESLAVNSGEFISSLFTHNPDLRDDINSNTAQPIQVLQASNAANTSLKGFRIFLPEWLCDHLEQKLSISSPTDIQIQAIPKLSALLKSNASERRSANNRQVWKTDIQQVMKADIAAEMQQSNTVVIQAETGSGKTLCFLLPLIESLALTPSSKRNRESGILALILAPTRELCQQIFSVLTTVLNQRDLHWIVPGLVVGGEKKKAEKARIRKGLNILIATPGRLLDHIKSTKNLILSGIKYFVLDEADRLLDLGFKDTLLQIQDALKSDEQSKDHISRSSIVHVLCSATMSKEILELSDVATNINSESSTKLGAQYIRSNNQDTRYTAPAQLAQSYLQVPAKLRLVTLYAMLRKACIKKERVIVFFACTDSVDFHFEVFGMPRDSPQLLTECIITSTELGFPTRLARLHGSLPQKQRTDTLRQFRKFCETGSEACILLCTDVTSRGVDLPFVDLVIQYDVPFSLDDYMHRIGRTARLGHKGTAKIFLMPSEMEYRPFVDEGVDVQISKDCETYDKVLETGLSNVNEGTPDKKTRHSGWEHKATIWQLHTEDRISKIEEFRNLAQKAFLSFMRAYTTHSTRKTPYLCLKNLHTGHVAKCFGLRQTPKQVSLMKMGPTSGKKRHQEEEKTQRQGSMKKPKRKYQSLMEHAALNQVENEFVTDYNDYSVTV